MKSEISIQISPRAVTLAAATSCRKMLSRTMTNQKPCLRMTVTEHEGPLAGVREVCWLDRFCQQGDESD